MLGADVLEEDDMLLWPKLSEQILEVWAANAEDQLVSLECLGPG